MVAFNSSCSLWQPIVEDTVCPYQIKAPGDRIYHSGWWSRDTSVYFFLSCSSNPRSDIQHLTPKYYRGAISFLLHSLLLPEDWKICQKMGKASIATVTKQNQQQVIIALKFTEIIHLFLCGVHHFLPQLRSSCDPTGMNAKYTWKSNYREQTESRLLVLVHYYLWLFSPLPQLPAEITGA